MIATPDTLIRPKVTLTDMDGNAFGLIGACAKALRRAGNSPEVIDAFQAEAMNGNYDHVLQTCMAYCDVH